MKSPGARLALFLLLALACGDGATAPSAASRMESVSGNEQPGFAGIPLEEQLVVRVLDIDGIPVPDVVVSWQVTSGGGSATPASSRSADDGTARTTWTLGLTAGLQSAVAQIQGLDAVVFTAIAAEIGATCTGSPLSLAVGEGVVMVGAQSSELCLSGGISGSRDFVAVAVNANRFASGDIDFTIAASGIVPATGPPSPSPDVVGGQIPGTADAEQHDYGFHDRIRAMERTELGPKVRSGAPAVVGLPTGPALSLSNPVLGETITLNSQAKSSCDNIKMTSARIVAISQRAILVADDANPAGGFSSAEYASIAATFDTLAYPVDVANFGEPADIDGNNRVVLFYTREVNALTPQGSPAGFVAGFFFSRDLFPRAGNAKLSPCPGSNEAEMMYLMVPDPLGTINGNKREKSFVLRRTSSTIAHELQHLINSSRRLYVNATSAFPESSWVEEGLAHSAEELVFFRASGLSPGQNVTASMIQSSQARVNAFNDFESENIGRLRNFLDEANSNWIFRSGSPDLAARGAAQWFFRYIVDRLSAGSASQQADLWHALVNSPDTGLRNVEGVIHADPMQWLRDWSVSLYADDAVSGLANRYRVPSWHLRSILNSIAPSLPYPVTIIVLNPSVARNLSVEPGGSIHMRFGISGGSEGRVAVTGSPSVPGNLSFVILRTR